MPDLIYRFDPDHEEPLPAPADAAAAEHRLLEGNRRFMRVFEASDVVHVSREQLGLGADGAPPAQRPYASVLACADARVPVELVFRCGANELFVVRVAGNVPGDECLGSLEYAAANLVPNLKLVVVLGHSGCGAVTAAVGTYLDPTTYPKSSMLRAVVDRVLPSVRAADRALQAEHGGNSPTSAAGRRALIEASVVLNAALASMTVLHDLGGTVRYGVFDLATREVRLDDPPEDATAFVRLASDVARSDLVRGMLAT